MFRLRYIGPKAFGILLFVLALELCARTDDWCRWSAPFWGNYSPSLLLVSDAAGLHGRPNARYEKWSINGNGFRGREVTVVKPSGVVRVVVVGASETFGLYESEGMEFPAQMQAILDNSRPGSYEVLNAASAGMTLPRIQHYFESWLARFEPDVLVLYPTPSFYLDSNAVSSKVDVRLGESSGESVRPRLSNKLSNVVKRIVPTEIQTYLKAAMIWIAVRKHPEEWVWKKPPSERLELFNSHLGELISSVRARKIQLILMTHANRFGETMSTEDKGQLIGWRRFFPRASEHCLLSMESVANDIILSLHQQEDGIHVIDIATKIPKSPDYFADFAHFTDRGASFVAAEVSKRIIMISSDGWLISKR